MEFHVDGDDVEPFTAAGHQGQFAIKQKLGDTAFNFFDFEGDGVNVALCHHDLPTLTRHQNQVVNDSDTFSFNLNHVRPSSHYHFQFEDPSCRNSNMSFANPPQMPCTFSQHPFTKPCHTHEMQTSGTTIFTSPLHTSSHEQTSAGENEALHQECETAKLAMSCMEQQLEVSDQAIEACNTEQYDAKAKNKVLKKYLLSCLQTMACTNCKLHRRSVLTLPCRHLLLCKACMEAHCATGHTHCPKCRQPISSHEEVCYQ